MKVTLGRTGITLVTLIALTARVALAENASPAPSASAAAESKLGLGDRRALKKYQDEKFGDLLKQIKASAGFDVEVEVKWDAVALPGGGDNYSTDAYFTNIFFVPLIDALKQVGKDEMGKAALKKGVKKIIITCDEASAPASNYINGLTLDGGVLTINWRPFSNADDTKERTEALVKTMEAKL